MDILNTALRFLLAGRGGICGHEPLWHPGPGGCLFSSVPLARRRKKEFPAFDLTLAFRRILRQAVVGIQGVSALTALAIWLLSFPNIFGYLLGMIVSFLQNLNRMTPNSRRNQRRFERIFADCYEPEDDEDTVDLPDLWK